MRRVIVNTPEELAELDTLLTNNKVWILDLETSGVEPYKGDIILGIAITAIDNLHSELPDTYYYLPINHNTQPYKNINKSIIIDLLDKNPEYIINHNIKFDIHFLELFGVKFPTTKLIDTMIAFHILNENENSLSLDALSNLYLDDTKDTELLINAAIKCGLIKAEPITDASRKTTMNKIYSNLALLHMPVVAVYAIKDINLTLRLFKFILDALETHENKRLIDIFNTSILYNKVIVDLEHRGLLLDVDVANNYEIEFNTDLCNMDEVLLDMYDISNANSIFQVRKALYGRSKIEVTEGNKTKIPDKFYLPTDVVKLKELSVEGGTNSELATILLEYRKSSKAVTTYIRPMLEARDAHNRIHPDFRISGTVAGRASCTKPNIQSFPKGELKNIIIAPQDYTLIEFDYSQMELRLAAHYSQSPIMIDAYLNNKDIHTLTAQTVLRKLEVTKEDRFHAKSINFGFLYGMQAEKFQTFAKNNYGLNLSIGEAVSYRTNFFNTYPELAELQSIVRAKAKKLKKIIMWTGRERRYDEIRSFPHTALNNLIQGGCSEIIRLGMIDIHNYLILHNSYIIMQVHDSVLLEVPTVLAYDIEFLTTIKNKLENFTGFKVPIKADCKRGQTWGSMMEININ